MEPADVILNGYWLFGGQIYYPDRGVNDFLGFFATEAGAVAFAEANTDCLMWFQIARIRNDQPWIVQEGIDDGTERKIAWTATNERPYSRILGEREAD